MSSLFIASDHAGVALKKFLIASLSDLKTSFHLVANDLGPSGDSAVDYPDYAAKLGHALQNAPESFGVLICGSGIGMSIAANKMKGIRAALCPSEEYARLARMHNHANVLCLGARFLKNKEALGILEAFLHTSPSTEARHVQRVTKTNQI